MPAMGRTDRRNVARNRGCRDPITDRGANDAPQRRIETAGPRLRRLSGHQDDNAVAVSGCVFQCRQSASVRRSQSAAVQIDNTVGNNFPRRQLTVPAAVKRGRWVDAARNRQWRFRQRRTRDLDRRGNGRWALVIRRRRATDICRDAPPESVFLRAERARHRQAGPASRAGRGRERNHARTCRPQCAAPRRRRPKKYRRGSLP